MTPFIVALGYAWVSLGIAFVLMPWSIPMETRIRAVGFWAAVAPFVFLVSEPLQILIAAALLLVLVAPVEPAKRAAFFIIAAPAVPMGVTAPIPFPGIQQLLIVSHYRIAVVVLLVPLLFLMRGQENRAPVSVSDFFPWFFLVYVASILLMLVDLTMAMRATVELALTLAIPYFLLRRAISTMDYIDSAFRAIVVVAVILAAVTLTASAKQWDFYLLNVPVNAFNIPEARFGFLRIVATINNTSLAFHMIMGLLGLEVLRRSELVPFVRLNLLRFLLLVGIFMCDSRGALGAAAVAYVVFFILLMPRGVLRSSLIGSIFIAMVAAAIWLAQGDFSSISNDSFTYRQLLLQASINYILMNPFFGDMTFLSSGYFDHLMQGQGIVDIANLYLQIALQYGFVGMALFFPIFLVPLYALARQVLSTAPNRHRFRSRQHGAAIKTRMFSPNWATKPARAVGVDERLSAWRTASAAVAALLLAWLVLSATTSDAGLMLHVGIVLAVLGRSLVSIGQQDASHQKWVAQKVTYKVIGP